MHDLPSPASESDSRKPAQALPELTKETWEYLELRLWNSFSKKIWLLVVGLATVLGLVATLGLNNFIQAKVDQDLKDEKERLAGLSSDFKAKHEAALVSRPSVLTFGCDWYRI